MTMNTNADPLKLGFGLMRLPRRGEEIDVEQVKEMVDLFLEAGFIYFDTAWIYRGSEEAIRKALVERYPRGKYLLATKLAAWSRCSTKEDTHAQFETSLERTGAGYFDNYLIHNLGEERTETFDKFDVWSFVQKKKAEGKIRKVGFSFHDHASVLEKILKAHPEMDFVQLQINYADWDDPVVESRRCYELAREYGKPVIVMEPVKGGLLADPPGEAAKIFREAAPESSCSSWAIRFAASLEGVQTVLSGMSSVAQMRDNLSFMRHFRPLSGEERQVISRVREALKKIPIVPCTSCNYCAKVCPADIAISGTLKALNTVKLYNNLATARQTEGWAVDPDKKHAYDCLKCGKCEAACPQHIPIRKHLEEAVKLLGLKP